MSASRTRLLFGTDEAVPEPRTLRAGPLEVTIRGPRIARIACGGVEVWHGVAFLFRDPDWCTPEPVVERASESVRASAFDIQAAGYFPVSPRIDFTITFHGDDAGRIVVTAEAVPSADIRASRLGLCVMHPISVCGARVHIRHIDGRVSRSTFPTLIPPWPPFMLIRAIRHEYAPGRWARCTFEGDVFELEDQRNNADASFKTYSRSNLMPRPYWLRAGVVIRQSVELEIETQAAIRPARRSSAVSVRVGAQVGTLPGVGVEISPVDARANEATRAALAGLRPAHLHLPVPESAEAIDWKAIAELLRIAGGKLWVDVVASEADEAAKRVNILREALASSGVGPAVVAVFPSEQRAIDAARRAFPNSAIGGGTPHFFVQLNRIENQGRVDFQAFTTSSIVHGADDESVMLTLQSLPSMVETLRARYPEVRIAVGPSGIAARASPLGNQPPSEGLHRIALARRDPRSRALYGAAWTLGYVAQLAPAGVESITLLSLTGDAGVVGVDQHGAVVCYPSYSVLQRLALPGSVRSVSVSEPTRIAALAIQRDGAQELLLANLTSEAVDVRAHGTAAGSVAVLDADACASAGVELDFWRRARRARRETTLRLDAYSIASVQW